MPLLSKTIRVFLLIAWLVGIPFLSASAQGGDAGAQATHAPEDITAVLLWKFALFTEWPESDSTTSNEFRIVIVGGDGRLKKALEPYVSKSMQGRAVRVERVRNPSDAIGSSLVFVSPGTKLNKDVRKRLLTQGGLICSTIPGFAANGGMVEIVVEPGKRPQFEINQVTMRLAQLELRARVLSMARKVYQ